MGKKIAKEECYKIELLVTVNNAHPDCNKALDDILFEALEDAPFQMDAVTINKIQDNVSESLK